jgi:hypothetical protein
MSCSVQNVPPRTPCVQILCGMHFIPAAWPACMAHKRLAEVIAIACVLALPACCTLPKQLLLCQPATGVTVTQVASHTTPLSFNVPCPAAFKQHTNNTKPRILHRCCKMKYVQVHLLTQGQIQHTCDALLAVETAATAACHNNKPTAAHIRYTFTVLVRLPSC